MYFYFMLHNIETVPGGTIVASYYVASVRASQATPGRVVKRAQQNGWGWGIVGVRARHR